MSTIHSVYRCLANPTLAAEALLLRDQEEDDEEQEDDEQGEEEESDEDEREGYSESAIHSRVCGGWAVNRFWVVRQGGTSNYHQLGFVHQQFESVSPTSVIPSHQQRLFSAKNSK